jgi:hypothetical protein
MFAALVEDILIAVASVLVVGSASAQTPVNCDGQRTQFGANGSMSYLGQFQKSARANAMSAFPPLATRQRTSLEVRFVPNSEVVVSFDRLVQAAGCYARAAIGPPLRYPSRGLRGIPKDNLFGQIDEGAQACGHVAASWIIEAISGIGGCPLA